jgi:hypothetical protein
LLVGVGGGEPFSQVSLLCQGIKQGILTIVVFRALGCRRKAAVITELFGQIPYSAEQGICVADQAMFREWQGK